MFYEFFCFSLARFQIASKLLYKASNPMTSRLVYRVALWDYLGENLDFNMNRIMIMREEYLKKHHSNILIYHPQISFPISLSLSLSLSLT